MTEAPQPEDRPIQFELGILSRVGGRSSNEDACAHWNDGHRLACVVADGAGGHGGGDVASRLAVQYLIERYARGELDEVGGIEPALRAASEEIRRRRADAPGQAQMHTTVVGLFVDMATMAATWGHVGDSRLYLFRYGQLAQRTLDHSTVQALIEAGRLQEDEVDGHPQRSELYCALGSAPEDLVAGVSAAPWRIEVGDAFLLCTDGFWEYLSPEILQQSLQDADNPQEWLDGLEQQLLAAVAGKPRHDNYSAITLWASPAPR